ncbi:MAG: S8 family serine peptidase [Alphaproteobacteria bacterium]|nr:S8 family serine peptidase [Alphaproteobacteria bacterium]
MRCRVVGIALLCYASTALAGIQDYDSIMSAVRARDLTQLKKLVSAGYDINATANGMTPLCETVYSKDYQGYEMLLTQGAALYALCMKNMSPQVANEFYAGQPKLGTYYTGTMADAQVTPGAGAIIADTLVYSGEVGLGAVALGALAFSGGGGGGGSSSGSGSGSDDDSGDDSGSGSSSGDTPIIIPDSPYQADQDDVSQYETVSYFAKVKMGEDKNGEDIYTNSFLPSLNASWAYARGYTGYKVNRNESGQLIESGENAITDEKVNIAILDNGFFINNTKLQSNLASSLFDANGQFSPPVISRIYGACKNSGDADCWKEGSITVHGGQESILIYQEYGTQRWVDLDEWEKYRYNTTFNLGGQDFYTYDAHNPLPAPDIAMMMSPDGLYGFLVNDSIQWSQHIYQRDENPTFSVDDLAVGWVYTPGDPSQNQSVYYCTKDRLFCAQKTTTGYQLISASALANLESSGQFVIKENLNMMHGSYVAGLAVGARDGSGNFHGVAFDAAWIPVAIDFPAGETLEYISDAVEFGADIINLSLAPTSPVALAGLKDGSDTLAKNLATNFVVHPEWKHAYEVAANHNKIMVFAAGNEGDEEGHDVDENNPYEWRYESSILAAAPALEEFSRGSDHDLTNLVVAVVSVDADNKLSDFSAICGQNKDWCIAAPGENLLSVNGMIGSGTSASAPLVSGALAVIKGAFPHLTNQQVVQILFETAQDLGEEGVDEIYGYGLVDLDAATKPVGQTVMAMSTVASGASISTASSKITIPTVLQGMTAKLPQNIVVLDKYQRAFAVPTATLIKTVKHENQLKNRFKSLMAGDEHQVVATDRFTMAWSERHEDHRSSEMKYGFVDVAMALSDELTFGAFYNENTENNGGTYMGRTLNNPFTKMKEAWGMNGSYNFAKNWRVDTMWATGKNAFVDEDDWNDMDANRVNVLQTTLTWSGLENVAFKLVSGLTDERASTLGLWGTGAFKSGNTRTTFFGAGATWRLSNKFQIEGMYYYGMAHNSDQSALIKMSNITAESFAFNAMYTPDERHSYGVALISPMRIRSGIAEINLPVARDSYEDVMYRSVARADLKPSAREYDLSSYYTNRLTDAVSVQTELGVRFNPDHQAGAAPDYRGLISVKIEI